MDPWTSITLAEWNVLGVTKNSLCTRSSLATASISLRSALQIYPFLSSEASPLPITTVHPVEHPRFRSGFLEDNLARLHLLHPSATSDNKRTNVCCKVRAGTIAAASGRTLRGEYKPWSPTNCTDLTPTQEVDDLKDELKEAKAHAEACQTEADWWRVTHYQVS